MSQMSRKVKCLAARLRRRGFNRLRFDRETGAVRVRCSQCEAMVINNMACHESGCPNNRRRVR